MSLLIRKLETEDCRIIADAFAQIGWASHKPLSQYERYLEEQLNGVTVHSRPLLTHVI